MFVTELEYSSQSRSSLFLRMIYNKDKDSAEDC